LATKFAFLLKLPTASFCKNLIVPLDFEKNAIFAENLQKNAEISDHNIDPRLLKASLHETLFSCRTTVSDKVRD
jgi:AAA+ superfamily predicted ATPase